MATRRIRATASAALLSLAITACGGGGGGTGSGGDEPAVATGVEDTESEAAVAADDVLAALGILEPGVDVADGVEELVDAAFRQGEDGEGLAIDDAVRTDLGGFAEVAWFDGALARIDADTTYVLVGFDATPGAARVATSLDVGRVWNRLRADTVDEYTVATDVGTAAVRGTAFWVECLVTGCTFAVLEGIVSLETTDGTVLELVAGTQVTVAPDGTPGPVEDTDIDDPWVVRNRGLDEDAGFDPLPTRSGDDGDDGDPCPLVAVPDGWVEEPDEQSEELGKCRYVLADAGANEFNVIQPVGPDSEQFRSQIERNRPFYDEFLAEIEASQCSDGLRAEFVPHQVSLGQGELYGYAWRVARGPLPPRFDTCTDGLGAAYYTVVIDGYAFSLGLAEVASPCQPPEPQGQTAEDWNAYVDCLFNQMLVVEDRYRQLGAVLLGARIID